MKVGRNDPCPCGSGKKFKKCHLGKRSVPPPEVLDNSMRQFAEYHARERERIARFGEIRPVVTTENWGKRFVAVGNRLYWGNWRFFPDFLDPYFCNVFGREWYEAQLATAEQERHPAFIWRTEALRFMNAQPPVSEEVYYAVPNGFMAAHMTLAYDLYVVGHNNTLDDELLARLKHRDQFQGARHELFTEATCLRGGFNVKHEDERDRATRHVEFVATHRRTGRHLAVEAKSKHRPGILGRAGAPEPTDKANFKFARLINDAARKRTDLPLVIFLDTNLPVPSADRFYEPESREPFRLSRRLATLLALIRDESGQSTDPYNLIVFTNHPHHYATENEADPRRHQLSVFSTRPQVAIGQDVLLELHNAANLYGNIPNNFPADR